MKRDRRESHPDRIRGDANAIGAHDAREDNDAQAHIRRTMNWSRSLAKPITLRDGRNIGTVAAALALMLSLPSLNQRQAVWHDVGELLAEAAKDKSWIRDVEAQLSQALKSEGLI